MFGNPFDADCQQKTRTGVKPKSPVNSSPVDTKQCEKPWNTMNATMAASTAPTDYDKADNLSTSTEQVPINSTSEAKKQQATTAEEPKVLNTLLPEIDKIQEIMNKSGEFEEKITSYSGVPGCKEYIYIEESLMSILLQLDKIETNGNVEIRKTRKSAVCKIQQMLTELENKAKDNMTVSEAASADDTSTTSETTDINMVDQSPVATTGSGQDAKSLDEETDVGASMEEVRVERSCEEEMESSISTTADLSDTLGALAAVNAEGTACEAGIDDLVSEHSSVDNVEPSIAVVTTDTSGEIAEDRVNSTESMDSQDPHD